MLERKKKIALLNLQVDDNFGGHLQRYALISTLQKLGNEVEHLNTRFPNSKKSIIKRLKGGLKRLVLYPYYAIKRNAEYKPLWLFKYYIRHEAVTEAFYDKYIPHTKRIYSNEELAQYQDFDCFVVGSDQVWRKNYASLYGLGTYMFDYLPTDKKRVAYGVSMGTDKNELSEQNIADFKVQYERFKAVSVREVTGLDLLNSYGCTNPKAEWVIDPTLLLDAEDYNKVINEGKTYPLEKKIFCYILNLDELKKDVITRIAREKSMDYQIWSPEQNLTVEQWLRSIRDAEYVITDSYHGLLFSLIFNKPFHLLRNESRWNARFDSIAEQLDVKLDAATQDYGKINNAIADSRAKSIRFLETNIG